MIIKTNTPLGIYEIGGRAKQEDAIFPPLNELSQDSRIFVVCDGLGGHSYGEVASATVAQALGEWTEKYCDKVYPLSEAVARQAVKNAQQALNEVALTHPSDKPLGTTMTMLVLGNNGAVATHIGDSRIYHIRPSENKILYRSRDHSLVNDLFAIGRLTKQETEVSTKKNILTRAMMPAPAHAAVPDVALITDIKADDYFMLCSDGVCGEINDEEILKTLSRSDMTDDMKLASLQMLAKDGKDNRSALLIHVANVEHEPSEILLTANEKEMCDKMVYADYLPEADATLNAVSPATPQESTSKAGNNESSTPPETPLSAQEEQNTIPPEYDVNNDNTAQLKKDKSTTKRVAMILLAALVLAAAILGMFYLNKPKAKPAPKPAIDTVADPDVSIDSLLPEMPSENDSLQVGTDVTVPPAPRITDVPTPTTPSSSSYSTGSNVKVPRVPKYVSADMPYDPYEGTENFGSDEPIHDDPDVTEQPSPRSEPQTASTSTPPPPSRQRASQDPASSNRNVAVPMPSGRRNPKPIETP